MNKAIAIIPARGGSKRIPRKNIKKFFDQPIIKYAIDAALKSNLFDTVMVSTDDGEIAQLSKQYGADVPFMRSEETSSDFATTSDVLYEVLEQYKSNGIEFDSLCCIYPCVPLLKSDLLKKAYNTFDESDAAALIPVIRFSYPIQRALRVTGEGVLEYTYAEYARTRSQDLESMYHDVGMFYLIKTNIFLREKILVPRGTVAYVMDELEVQDIDDPKDWEMAELKYKLINGLT